MSGLVLKLGPKERVLINGAVIENGDRRTRLSIMTPNANILRLRDALHPEEVTTPVRRVCYIAQLVLSGDADARGRARANPAWDGTAEPGLHRPRQPGATGAGHRQPRGWSDLPDPQGAAQPAAARGTASGGRRA
jgi:hypothetical protein